jgi:uncharacterized iron-regulated protein
MAPGAGAPPVTACAGPAGWVNQAGDLIASPLPAAARSRGVLLGEEHDRVIDHTWELAALAYFDRVRPGLMLGLEMFPRSRQYALDGWVSGMESEQSFLLQSDWAHVWGFDPNLYLPIFRFARDHHMPLLALNVDGALVHTVAHQGWAQVPVAAREGVGDPAPPEPAYRAMLDEEMAEHAGPRMKASQIAHFIDAQLLWDRAMAEAIARAHAAEPGRLIVAMMGAGHLEHRWGIPHQLASLGLPDAAVLLPSAESCGGAAKD